MNNLVTFVGRRAAIIRIDAAFRLDGLERISTQTLMDILEVPQRKRTAGVGIGTLRPRWLSWDGRQSTFVT
jgi:hypothetical protein